MKVEETSRAWSVGRKRVWVSCCVLRRFCMIERNRKNEWFTVQKKSPARRYGGSVKSCLSLRSPGRVRLPAYPAKSTSNLSTKTMLLQSEWHPYMDQGTWYIIPHKMIALKKARAILYYLSCLQWSIFDKLFSIYFVMYFALLPTNYSVLTVFQTLFTLPATRRVCFLFHIVPVTEEIREERHFTGRGWNDISY